MTMERVLCEAMYCTSPATHAMRDTTDGTVWHWCEHHA